MIFNFDRHSASGYAKAKQIAVVNVENNTDKPSALRWVSLVSASKILSKVKPPVLLEKA